LGDRITLTGVTLPAAAQSGAGLPVTLYGQANAQVEQDYTLFLHLVDGQGTKVAQVDAQPVDAAGRLPTSAWPPGQTVAGTYTLALPAGLPPGDYHVLAGLYFWQDGRRLPVQGAQAQPGDVVDLGAVQVE
jgi:hypothetical protein